MYNAAKAAGEVPMMEGKCPMTFAGYEFLALRAVRASEDALQATFAWCYLTLCWSLMARYAVLLSPPPRPAPEKA